MKRLRSLGRWFARTFHTVTAQAILHYSLRREIREETQVRDDDMHALVATRHELASRLTDPVLEQFEDRERERRNSIEAKARTNLVAISLAAAIATALFGLLSEPASHVARPASALSGQIGYAAILLGWIYFISGGFFAFEVLDVRKVWRRRPRIICILTMSDCARQDSST